MTEDGNELDQSYEQDSWLTSVFAAATGPLIDTAFADRVLARLQRKERVRMLVILGTAAFAATVTASLAGMMPALNTDLFKAPDWLTSTRTMFALIGVSIAAFATWVVAEEA